MIAERRTQERTQVKILTDCIRSGEYARQDIYSLTLDLSLEGAHIITSKGIEPGEQFAIVLEIPKYFIPLLVYGEVMWAKRIKISCEGGGGDRDFIEAGIKFFNMETFDAQKLLNFLSFRKDQICDLKLSIEKKLNNSTSPDNRFSFI